MLRACLEIAWGLLFADLFIAFMLVLVPGLDVLSIRNHLVVAAIVFGPFVIVASYRFPAE